MIQTNPTMFLHDLRASAGFAQTLACLTYFNALLIVSITSSVLPFALTEHIGVPESRVQLWISFLFAAIGAAFSLASVIGGRIAAIGAHRNIFCLLSLLILIGATVVVLRSRTITIFLAARIVQGLASGLCCAFDNALLLAKVGPEKMADAQEWVGFCWDLGYFVGPILGGIVYQYGGWDAVWAPAFALMVVGFVMRLAVVVSRTTEIGRSRQNSRQGDEARPLLRDDRSRPAVVGSSSASIHTTASAVETNAEAVSDPPARTPLLKLFTLPRLVVSLLGVLALESVTGVMEIAMPLHTLSLFHLTPTQVSLLFLPLTLPPLFSPLAGDLVDRIGPRWPAVSGYILGAGAFVTLAFVIHPLRTDLALLIIGLVLHGCYVAMVYPALHAGAVLAVQDVGRTPRGGDRTAVEARGRVIGLTQSIESLGLVLGGLYIGPLTTAVGWRGLCWFMTGLSGALGVLTLFVNRGRLSFGRGWKSGAEEEA